MKKICHITSVHPRYDTRIFQKMCKYLAQGNFNLLFFFVGMFILTPVAVILANALFEFIFVNVLPDSLQSLWLVANAGAPQCAIFTTAETANYALNGVPSLW
ncbi:MAG: hypothetical protein EBR50_07700, partial [Proteobacteria bacterium]|nr:hypothetical protein [Pseudomonadota bacterium]